MKRKIIKINEDLCNGCGNCVTGCNEGALKVINGKAKLVREDFCDGLGHCIGTCPTGALTIEERETIAFDEKLISEIKEQNTLDKYPEFESKCGCPGSQMKAPVKQIKLEAVNSNNVSLVNVSDLDQWPVQLHLVNPRSSFFNNKELVVLSTCSPVASADIHWRFIRGRAVVLACPKLDNTSPYRDKLSEIIKLNIIPKIIIVIMEVPCCKSLSSIVKDACRDSQKDVELEEYIVALDGSLKGNKKL